MSWKFTCPSCKSVSEEDDETMGIAICETRGCSAYGKTVRVDENAKVDETPQAVSVSDNGRSITINLTINLGAR